MGLPLNLAITASEMASADALPAKYAWMACQFSPYGEGITNIPMQLPPGSMLILNDRMPCQGHSPNLVAGQIADILSRCSCESLLLDFQRPDNPEAEAIVRTLMEALPCPVAVTEHYARDLECPVFLAPAPLHTPLREHLAPWQDREIWLEAALCQEVITVSRDGTTIAPQFPPDGLEGGFWEEELCCRYRTDIRETQVCFTLFDTPESLQKKLEQAQSLGVKRAVGLYQELGEKNILPQ